MIYIYVRKLINVSTQYQLMSSLSLKRMPENIFDLKHHLICDHGEKITVLLKWERLSILHGYLLNVSNCPLLSNGLPM